MKQSQVEDTNDRLEHMARVCGALSTFFQQASALSQHEQTTLLVPTDVWEALRDVVNEQGATP